MTLDAERVGALAERERIADAVHGEVLQLLFAATLDLDAPTRSQLDSARAEIDEAVIALRELVSISPGSRNWRRAR